MISKELLSEVLEKDAYPYDYAQNGRVLRYAFFGNINRKRHINTYELAHKCKEWAHKLGFMVQSYQYNTKARVDLLKSCDIDEIFIEETEPEAIFKACEWILKDKR